MSISLPDICAEVLLDEGLIAARVAEMGRQITEAHAGKTVHLVTVLKGGLFFLADLARAIDLDVRLDFLAVSPYAPGQGGVVRVTKDLDDDIADRVVILVEDVIDTGLTVNYVRTMLEERGPADLEIATLLDKPGRRIAPVPIDYVGFEMGDRFLVGYGLDLDGRFRNLRCIASLRDDVVLG